MCAYVVVSYDLMRKSRVREEWDGLMFKSEEITETLSGEITGMEWYHHSNQVGALWTFWG